MKSQSRFDSLAFLPFTVADAAQTFLADGVTDTLNANVGRVNSGRVLARSAVYNLKAATVLPGRIGTRPTGYSVRVELIEAAAS